MVSDSAIATQLPNSAAPACVSVLLPLPLQGAYDYAVQTELTPELPQPGSFVVVPLGSREVVGVVWDAVKNVETKPVDPAKLKPVTEILNAPPMPDALRRFVEWVAHYTFTPPGAILRLAMRSVASLGPPKFRKAYRLGGPLPVRMTPARQRVLNAAEGLPPLTPMDLAERAGVSTGVIKGLIDAGTLICELFPVDPPFAIPDGDAPGPELSNMQAVAADELSDAVTKRTFDVLLLDGVTGSGKTEVYFEAIARALREGGQVLILVPEIALTVQFLDRFAQRFGCRPAEWHSDLSSSERRRTWREVAKGDARVVVGARSALFLPLPDLSLIIVDEEHDSSYKQEEGAIYNARDMAVVRGRLCNAPVVLASATPSLETHVNARDGRYRRLVLPNRHGQAVMPDVDVIDLRETPPDPGKWIAPPLAEAIESVLRDGEQAMLFLNRRGYAPLTLCRTCGHRIMCPNCSTWLVQHRFRARLLCHHCGYEAPEPKVCPACNEENTMAACGPGVERIAEEVAGRFPDHVSETLSSDRVGGPAALQETLGRMRDGEIDLLIGTQIVAKGHHFARLTLVGIVDADLGLEGGDPRAAERTFQLLSQVAGRAGREERSGRVFLQTRMPDHPVIQALVAGDRDAFLEQESELRGEAQLPPFGKLVSVIVSGPERTVVEETAQKLAKCAPDTGGAIVYGPAEAPIFLLRGRYRLRLLLKASKQLNAQAFLAAWFRDFRSPNSVRVHVDVDPYSFL